MAAKMPAMRLGNLDIAIVRDAEFRLDGGAMFGVVPKVLWEKKFPADEKNRVRLATNCLLVRGDGFTVLIESGLGAKWDEKSREIFAIDQKTTLAAELERHGVAVEDVDALILSHLHFDHAGGATRRENGRVVPTFPNATLYVQETELAHARAPHERDRASYFRRTGSLTRRPGASRRSRVRRRSVPASRPCRYPGTTKGCRRSESSRTGRPPSTSPMRCRRPRIFRSPG